MQLADHLGLHPAQLAEQELPEQRVIAVPASTAVERDQEQVRRLQAAEQRLRAGFADDGVAQRGTELIEHRGGPQELLRALRQPSQRLAVQVVRHIPVLAGDRRRIIAAVPRDQRGEVQARPASPRSALSRRPPPPR